MADAGAVRIRAILEAPSAALEKAIEALRVGIGGAEGLNAEIPASAGRAIEKMRRIYSQMSQEIEAIDTSSGIKDESLGALQRMDIGLHNLANGIAQGSGEEAARSFSMAVRRLDAAGAGIDRAIRRVR